MTRQGAELGRSWAIAAWALGALTVVVTLLRHRRFWHDDAFITARYARRLARTGSLRWNEGDELVEGFTSLVDVWLTAPLHLLWAPAEAAVQAVHGLLWVVALAYTRRWLHRRHGPGATTEVAWVWLAATSGLWIWILGGLETPLHAAAIVVAMTLAIDALESPLDPSLGWGASAALGTLFAIRPDGASFGLVVGVMMTARLGLSAGPVHARRRAWLRFAVGGLLPLVLVQTWRYGVFGEWVPNTVIAKAWGVPRATLLQTGSAYAAGALTAAPFLLPAALALGVATTLRRRQWIPVTLLATVAAAVLLVAWAGGDHMVAHRLLLPVAGPAALLVAEVLPTLSRLTQRVVASLALSGLLAQWVVPPYNLERDPAARVGEVMGRFLDRHLPPGSIVATATAGSTPFFADGLVFVDTLGLNDRHIARREVGGIAVEWQRVPGHAKGDGAYVLDRAPDVVVVGPAQGETVGEPMFLTDVELGEDARFAARYVALSFDVARTVHADPSHWWHTELDLPLVVHVRRDSEVLERLLPLADEQVWPAECAIPHCVGVPLPRCTLARHER